MFLSRGAVAKRIICGINIRLKLKLYSSILSYYRYVEFTALKRRVSAFLNKRWGCYTCSMGLA